MRVIYCCIGFLLLYLFGTPISVRILNVGNTAGLTIGAGFVLYGILRNKLPKSFRTVLRIGFLGGVLLLAAEGLFMWKQAAVIPKNQDATVIILGCGIKGDNPSLMLRQRIDAAEDYLKAHPELKAICTGGQGPGENLSEGDCIKRELVAAGISPDRLYVEDRSTSTSENLAYALEIIRAEGLCEELIIVSHEFHLYRACHMAARMGLKSESVAANTPGWLFPTFFLRECFAILKEWVLPDVIAAVP